LTRARERREAALMLEVALLPLSPTVEPAVLALIARRRNRPGPRPLPTGAIDRELLK
jgi:hypothetical protein